MADWIDLDGNLGITNDPYQGHQVLDGTIHLNDTNGIGLINPTWDKIESYVKKYQIVFLLFLTFMFTNCKPFFKKAADEKMTEVQNDTLDEYFSALYTAKMFNGAVAIKRNGKLIFKK